MRYVKLGLWATAGIISSIHPFGSFSPTCATAYAQDAQKKIAGDIVSVSGTVFLRSDKKDQPSRTAKAGEYVYAQDIINTGSDGRIKVLMKDKSIVDLGPSALFKVDKFDGKTGAADREVEVSMVYGTMRAAITQKLQGKGKFKVRTPSATMGVRGTEFVVKSEIRDMKDVGRMLNGGSNNVMPPAGFASADGSSAANTQVTVLQGKVDVAKKDFDASAAGAGRVPASAGVVSLGAGAQVVSGQAETAVAAPQQVSAVQMQAVSSEAKVTDNTFKNAVVVEPSSGNGQPASEPAKQVIATAVNLPPPPAVKPSELGIPGALGVNQIFNPVPVNLQGVQKRLRVVIVRQ